MENPRKKSCMQCRMSKTRCNLSIPHCQRCERRKLPCKYETIHREATTPADKNSLQHSWVAGTKSTTVSARNPQNETTPLDQNSAACLDSGNASIPELFELDFNSTVDSENCIFGISNMEWNIDEGLQFQAPEDSNQSRDEAESVERVSQPDVSWFAPIPNAGHTAAPDQPIPIPAEDAKIIDLVYTVMRGTSLVVSGWRALDSDLLKKPNFLKRKSETTSSKLIAGNYIWETIKSYTTQFVEGELPPFIHKKSFIVGRPSFEKETCDLPEPLANCSSILSMYQKQTPASRNLVSKTLLLEVQRLSEESDDVVAYSASADDEIAVEVQKNGFQSTSERMGRFPSWEEWILAESKRRTLITLHLLDVILDLRVDKYQQGSCSIMDQIPLPCSKYLWEAETILLWEQEFKKYLQKRKVGEVRTIGKLRASVNQNTNKLDVGLVEDLGDWAAGIDSFGAMLLTGIMA
ncbi:hypothetical protein G7Y89_g2655 [Cudoniella acicularis]|uniref:Zn(2)-C6 fungal-type domain-containing protein n=1 Tax=Cudoniella acicularis TaxID=354080 RepID=A0A8H4W5X7_9HELO|nr:hypothetical protein G7Y89_g2655 [Cudoniella acicularis]